jgi:iron complex outermembrane receptor protein
MQVSAIEHDLTGNPTPVTINAAKVRIKGAEFELDWRVIGNDEIHGYATYLDARYTSFPNGVNASVNPDGIYNSVIGALNARGANYVPLATNLPTDFVGNHLPNASEETFRAAYSHTFPLGAAGSLIPRRSFTGKPGVTPTSRTAGSRGAGTIRAAISTSPTRAHLIV